VLLRTEQLTAEMERVRRGVLQQLPRSDFDELVGRAAAATAAQSDPPRLVETRYRAVLTGDSLAGSASWKLFHSHPTPGLLPLEPFNLALRKATWDDGSPALVGDFDTRPQAPGVELLVGRPGEQSLNLEWSCRGVPGPGGLRFDLRLPACAVAVLDLDLPADREPAVSREDGLLTGPFPGPAADRRTWKLAFANASRIDLTVGPNRPSMPPLILAKARVGQEVTPGETDCEFTFDLEVPHGGVRDLAIDCDGNFRPTDVAIRNLERWESRPGDDKHPPRVLVHLREPLRSGSLTIQGIVPAVPGRGWTSPSAVVVGAVPRGESLVIRVHPDLRLDDWRSGSFRLAESAVTPDRWQTLKLEAGLIRSGPARPTARLRLAGPEYHVRERLGWVADTSRMTLTAQLAFEVARGPVFQVPLRMPAGWTVERIEADPPDLLAATDPPPAGPTVNVELQRPLTSTSSGRLTLQLVRRLPAGGLEEAIPFPDVVPTAAKSRDGTLSIRVGSGLQSSVAGAPAADAKPTDREAALADGPPPDYIFSLRTAAIDGVLHLARRPVRYRAVTTSTVVLSVPQATISCRIRLEPRLGGVDAFAVQVPGASEPWDWRVVQGDTRVRSVQSMAAPPPRLLAALAARSPWESVASLGVPYTPASGWWQVMLTRPVTEPVELEAQAVVPVAAGQPWAVPLVRVPSADPQENEIGLDLSASHGSHIRPEGATDVSAADASPWQRKFRYGEQPASLTLVLGADDGPAILDNACLVTYAADPPLLVHRLSFRLRDWSRATVPLDLPAGAVVRQARINGIVASHAAADASEGASHLELPAPTDTRTLTFDVVYTTSFSGAGLLTRLDIVLPRLPIDGVELRRFLGLPSDVAPLWSPNWHRLSNDEAQGLSGSFPAGNEPGPFPADLVGAMWERVDGDETVRLVRPGQLSWIGFVLAVVGLVAARSWPARRQWVGLLGWLGGTAAVVLWLPSPLAAVARWPLLTALLVAVWRMIPRRQQTDPPTVVAPRSSAVRALTAIWIAVVMNLPVALDGRLSAAGPSPILVYLVPGPADAPEPRTVLTPPELLDRLRAQAGRGPARLAGAAWLDARYDGRLTGGQAQFSAVLHLHSFADEPPPLALPLTGVQLGEATLDGAAAFLRAGGDRYLVPVHGRGPHTLRLSFTVPCPGPAEDRELRFGIPEVPIAHLSLLGPAGATNLQALAWRGEQHVETDGDRPRLEADLGRVAAVHVRFRVNGPKPPTATVRTQETYLWDLTESAARLLGDIRFNIGPGSVSTLAVGLPKDLEVAAVTARPVESPAAGSVPGWLRDWRIDPPPTANGRRSLVLEFAAPINGSWQIDLELVPREPFGPSFGLPFPSAVGVRSAAPVVAWRAEGLDLVDAPPDSVAPLSNDLFLRDHWLSAKVEADPRPPTKAYQRKTLGAAPAIRFRATTEPREQATADIFWRIGPRRAEAEIAARVTVPGGHVALVEWSVPAAVTVSDVRGPDVHCWSRTGSRLQVWLAKPTAEATMQVIGFVTRPVPAGRFDVPTIRPRTASFGGALRLTAGDGLTLTPAESAHLKELPATGPDGRELSYTIGPEPPSGGGVYRAAVDVRAAGSGRR
jgi:hypothetical protein